MDFDGLYLFWEKIVREAAKYLRVFGL